MLPLKCVVPQNTHYLSLRKDFFLDPPSPSTPLKILIEAEHTFNTFLVLEKPQGNCNHFCVGSKIYKLLLLFYSLFRQNVQNVTETCICPVLHSLVFLLPGTSYMPTLLAIPGYFPASIYTPGWKGKG